MSNVSGAGSASFVGEVIVFSALSFLNNVGLHQAMNPAAISAKVGKILVADMAEYLRRPFCL